MPWPGVDSAVNSSYRTAAATRAPIRRDPLAIDLDGDGIETIGVTGTPVLFDHNADGIKTGTGWVAGDDGWLALDRDGNGLIDSGRELFGADTVLSGTPGVDAVYATTGFEALQALDSNGDNVFNAADTAFGQVRIWQDANQDGVSQNNELFTLAQKNIASINLNASTTTQNLGNGNVVSGTATVTRTNGTTTLAETVGVAADTTAANLQLGSNPFYRDFTDTVALTTQAQDLPDMHGSGWVRDLREAMSQGDSYGQALTNKVAQFAQATTKEAQMALLDEVIGLWSATNSVWPGVGYANLVSINGPFYVVAGDAATSEKLQACIPVLEVFNGMSVTDAGIQAPVGTTYNLLANQATIMLQAYESLRQSVYSALVVQTRLKPYLDAVSLVIDEAGVRFDTAPAEALVLNRAAADGYNTLLDLVELKHYAAASVSSVGWDIYQTMEHLLETTTITPAMQTLLTSERIVSLGATGTNYTVTNAAGQIVLANDLANVLVGGGGADVLHAGAGNDTLNAMGNGDTLDGGDGDDALSTSPALYSGTGTTYIGGKGNDTITGNYTGDSYIFNLGDGQDTVNDYSGGYANTDVLRFGAGILPSDVTPVRSGTNLVFKFANGTDQITVNNWFSSDEGFYQIEQVQFADGTTWNSTRIAEAMLTDMTGTSAVDSLTGTAGSDNILGLEGNDTLNGGSGHDRLDGGLGNDTLIGGLGDDTYIVNSTADTVTENANEGLDTVVSSVTWNLGANLENLSLSGTAAINGTGNALNNSLVGNSAANTLNGGAGADFMVGLGGNDTYVVDNVNDHIVENLNEGTDTVQSSITWALGANLENLTLTGTATINGTGNELNNALVGNSAANKLIGGAGNDTLNGGAGADTLVGGLGDDAYIVDNIGDIVTEAANEGTDTIQSSINWTLGANLEKLTLTGSAAINGTGNELANTLTGNSGVNTLTGGAGNDTLNGGAGADTLIGGTGDDTYVVDNTGDVITEALNEGMDLVQSSITWTLGSNLENLTLTGSTTTNGTGNELNNVLVGNSANNTLTGGAGNDTLNGGTGGDTLLGGLGDDTYVVDNTGDIVTEAINEGVDLVQSSITWTLDTNLENLTLTGSAVINATGNALDNILLGNSANNTLTGGAGNDTLDGGAGSDTMLGGVGNDTYVVNVATDVITELSAEGIDTVKSSVTWTLGANLENLSLTGTSAINGTGNELDNFLLGNSGNNTLNGGAGNDTLEGGAGNDTLIGGAGNDGYRFGRGYASDVIQENDSTSVNTDVLQFLSGIASDQLWFKKVTNNLEVSIIGTTDKATLTNWYLGNQYHVEQFKTSDGKVLLDSQVQNLVSAMAAFAPPASGQTTLPANYATTLSPVIAVNWQ